MPLFEKAQVRRERRARQRAFPREIHRDLRERRRDREEREGRR